MTITIKQCPCGAAGCSTYYLSGIGNFYQGCGFTEPEAALIAELLNANPGRLALAQNMDELTTEEKQFCLDIMQMGGQEVSRTGWKKLSRLVELGILDVSVPRGIGKSFKRATMKGETTHD